MNRAGHGNRSRARPTTERYQIMQYIDRHAPHSCFLELTQELTADCDADFDTFDEALEREFAERRLQLTNFE